MKRLLCAAPFVVLLACSKPDAALPPAPTASADAGVAEKHEGLGSVMAQVGRRFELAGRASQAGRFELASFEVGELEELFDGDVPNAELPKEGPTAHIPKMAAAFRATNLPELDRAAAAKDGAAFERAFATTAAACNACHSASEKAFIEIPTEVGKAVPSLDPIAVRADAGATAPSPASKRTGSSRPAQAGDIVDPFRGRN